MRRTVRSSTDRAAAVSRLSRVAASGVASAATTIEAGSTEGLAPDCGESLIGPSILNALLGMRHPGAAVGQRFLIATSGRCSEILAALAGTRAAKARHAVAALAPAYRPRRPTETVLYAVVRNHLETFLAHTRETYEAPLPRYVEQELRGYLRCGVLAHGFVRAHCDTCGHDLLVAFSCKARAACPSCAGRRMANVAAHLVDRVLPAVPVRQWVLSLPFELRALAAFRADVLSALGRMFVEAVFARYRTWAKRQAFGDAPTGAVTHVQRFGSSINLNVHYHSMRLDGAFTRDGQGRARFHPAPPPTREELGEVVRRVRRRALAWLARSKLLDASPAQRCPRSQARRPRWTPALRSRCSADRCKRCAMGTTPSTTAASRRRRATRAPSNSTASTCTYALHETAFST